MFYTDYQSVADPAVRRRFAAAWGVPEESLSLKPGLKVTEIVAEDSPVKGMYVFGENPVISDPDVAHAPSTCSTSSEFLVVQDLYPDRHARYADVVLPGSSFAEKDGTFVNTERAHQRVREGVRPAGPRPRRPRRPGGAVGPRRTAGPVPPNAEAVMEEIPPVTPSWRA